MLGELDKQLKSQLLSAPKSTDDKYSRGVVGFFTGSQKYPGAALLGIEAAFEAEIGMVCYDGPQAIRGLILTQRPEVVLGLERADSLVVGSGFDLGDDAGRTQLQDLAKLAKPKVIDAGALEVVDFSELVSIGILTPHLAEAKRLANRLGMGAKDLDSDAAQLASKLAEATGQVVMLKGNLTHLAAPGYKHIVSGPGSTHLATAGTGDVLAGLIGALLARLTKFQIEINFEIAIALSALANQLISTAAEIAASRGEFGASRVAAAISEAISAERA